jgi:hypothetical protein
MYWLYTDDYPYDGFDTWGLYIVEDEMDVDEDGIDLVTIVECLYDSNNDPLRLGGLEEIFEDSVEDGKDSRSQQRILKFLLGREF